MLIDVDTITQEFWTMMTRLNYTLETRHIAIGLTSRLRRAFQDQIDEAITSQGEPGGSAWAPLSDWRIRDRGSASPMLIDSGELFGTEVKRYRGVVRLVGQGFTFNFPDTKEMTGHAWGIMGGQLVNPLGATPLAATPRRVLGGRNRQERDSIEALIAYFISEGWQVEII
jgi:hypothetical protein